MSDKKNAHGSAAPDPQATPKNAAPTLPQTCQNVQGCWYKALYSNEMQLLHAVGASANEILVYCALTRFKDPKGGVYCVPHGLIAQELGMDPTTVRKAISGLVRKGVIECVRKPYHGSAAAYRVKQHDTSEGLTCIENGTRAKGSSTENGTRAKGSSTKNGTREAEKQAENGTRGGVRVPNTVQNCAENGTLKEYKKDIGCGLLSKAAPQLTPEQMEAMRLEQVNLRRFGGSLPNGSR